jgi:outer membrane protein TolC
VSTQAPAGGTSVTLSGELAPYLQTALGQSPQLKAAYAAWDAEVRGIQGAATLPEPTLGLGVFLRSVETRVGPQQARISLQQSLPWPTELSGRHDAAVAQARIAQAQFDAVVLDVSAQVLNAYWTLWEVRETRRAHSAHVVVLEDLSTTLRARLETGSATLADVQQVDLTRARLEDSLLSLDAQERRAVARLRAVIGGVPGELPTLQGPVVAQEPELNLDQVTEMASAHPLIGAAGAREDAAQAAVQVAQSQRAPGLTLGVDWMPTGPSAMDDVESGKDAVMLGVGFRIPLWQRAYAEDVRAMTAMQDLRAAQSQGLRVQLSAQVEDAYIRVVDGARRVDVVQYSLLPQAEGTYAALLGSYAVGKANVAQVLLAQRDLLELQVLLDREQAELERAWADLEQLCGTSLERRGTEPSP